MNIRHTHRRLFAIAIAGPLLFGACITDSSEPAATPAPTDRTESVTSLPVNVPDPANAPAPEHYTVVRGDTMARIAIAHDVTLADLLAVNDVPNPALIEPGLELLIPPLPEPIVTAPVVSEPADSRAGSSSTSAGAAPAVAAAASTDEAWYQPVADRLPALPEPLEDAEPAILAAGAVALALVAVGVIAVLVPLLYSFVAAAASGLAFGGRGLQAAFAGIPRPAEHSVEDDDGTDGPSRRFPHPFGWRPRLGISKLSLPSARPRFRRSSAPPPLEVAPDAASEDPPPPTSPPLENDALPVPEPTPEVIPTPAPFAPLEAAAPLSTAPLATTPVAAPPVAAPVLAPPVPPVPAPADPLASLVTPPPVQDDTLRGPTPPAPTPPASTPPEAPLPPLPSALPAAPEEPSTPGRLARLRGVIAARAAIVAAAIAAAAVVAGVYLRAAAVTTGRALGRWSKIAAIATWHLTLRGLRAGGRLALRGARKAATIPGRLLHQQAEQRRRKQFRERVESSAAARMRLGLREDNENYLQESLDESLAEGWRLEAAWCLQLLAEEADRRGDRALAELRRVRARELIRDHAIEEEARP